MILTAQAGWHSSAPPWMTKEKYQSAPLVLCVVRKDDQLFSLSKTQLNRCTKLRSTAELRSIYRSQFGTELRPDWWRKRENVCPNLINEWIVDNSIPVTLEHDKRISLRTECLRVTLDCESNSFHRLCTELRSAYWAKLSRSQFGRSQFGTLLYGQYSGERRRRRSISSERQDQFHHFAWFFVLPRRPTSYFTFGDVWRRRILVGEKDW